MDFNFGMDFGLPAPLYPFVRLAPTLAGSQYGLFSYTFTAAGKIKHTYATTQTGVEYDLSDGYTVTAGDVFSTPAACTDILVDDISVGLGGAAPNDGKLHIVTFVVNSGAAITHLWQDGASAAFFQGQYFNLELTDASDVTITDIPFDSGSILYQLARGTALGANQILNGSNLTTTDNWTPYVNAILAAVGGMLSITASAASSTRATQPFTTIIGKTYLLNVDFINDNGNTVLVGFSNLANGGAADFVTSSATSGTLQHTFKATATTTYVSLSRSTTTTTEILYGNIKTQQLPDTAVLLTNFALSNWDKYAQQRNYVYLAITYLLAWVDVTDPSNFIEVA